MTYFGVPNSFRCLGINYEEQTSVSVIVIRTITIPIIIIIVIIIVPAYMCTYTVNHYIILYTDLLQITETMAMDLAL